MSNKTGKGILTGKRFFIDPKVDNATSVKVKQKLIALGGKVEEFLDKGIHFALTNEATPTSSGKDERRHRLSPYSPFGTTSPSIEHSYSMGLRGKRLAKQASSKTQATSIIDTAKSFGIKIRLIDEVLSWLNKKTENMNISAAGQILRSHQPSDIQLKDPCIKVEDFGRSPLLLRYYHHFVGLKKENKLSALCLKPIYEEFESFSHLDLTVKGPKCPMVNAHNPARTKRNEKKNLEKKGFCECCQCSYLNERKHRKTTDHLSFGETTSHFEKLDDYVSTQNLNLDKFLSRFKRKEGDSDSSGNEKYSLQLQQEPISVDASCEETLSHSSVKSPDVKSPHNKPKPSATTPLRRSPRKSVRADSPEITKSKKGEIKRRMFDAKDENKEPTRDCHSRVLPKSDSTPVSVSIRGVPASINVGSQQLDFTLVPTVSLEELPPSSFKRKRIQSCDGQLTSPLTEISDSPLSRLRSFKRKMEELSFDLQNTTKSPQSSKKSRLLGVADIASSSDEELSRLLKSSTGIANVDNFFGF